MKGTLRMFLTLCIAMLSMTLVQAQERTYSGVVKDEGGAPFIGASVIIPGTTIGVSTGVDGSYSIKAPSGSQLEFSALGMKAQTFTAGATTSINVTLIPEATELDVVIAYGTAKKKDLTGSVSSMDAELLAKESNSTISRALEGAIPGLQVSASNMGGQPGEDMKMILRGLGSAIAENSYALVVVDGVASSNPNVLTLMNPKDIESLNVSKDAVSNSMYGSRGANGVIFVTTKKGRIGKPQISFEGRWGVNKMGSYGYDYYNDPTRVYEYAWKSIYNRALYLNPNYNQPGEPLTNLNVTEAQKAAAAQYASDNLWQTFGEARSQLGGYAVYTIPTGEYMVNPDGKLNPKIDQSKRLWDDDWYKELIQQKFRQQYNISVGGGTEKTNYFLSTGYQTDPSFIRGSSFSRYNARVNVDTKATSWLKTGINMAYGYRSRQQPSTRYGANPGASGENLFQWIYGGQTLAPIWARDRNGNFIDKDGKPTTDKNAAIYDLGNGQTESQPGIPDTWRSNARGRNAVYFRDHDKWIRNSHDFNGRGYVEASFLRDFRFNVGIGLDQTMNFTNRYQNKVQSPLNNSTQGGLSQIFDTYTALNNTQMLYWGHKYGGKHQVDAMAGHEFYWEETRSLTGNRYLSLIDDFNEGGNFLGVGSGSATYGAPISSGLDKSALEGYMMRANYNYDSKYYAAGSIRMDGTSKLRDNSKRWGTFWSASGAWRISQEEWMKTDWLDDLKLRASYGTMGNVNGVGKYAGYTIWNLINTGDVKDPVTSIGFGSYGNPNLKWETVSTFEVGADFRLWNRFSGSIAYYNRNTSDMIWKRPVATSLGVLNVLENSAGMRNAGIEMEFNVDIIKNDNLLWSASVNGTHYKNQLTKVPMGTGSDELGGNFTSGPSSNVDGAIFYLRGEGKDYFNIYMPKYAGVDQKSGKAMVYHRVTEADQKAGKYLNSAVGADVATTDVSDFTRYEIGSAIPDLFGGFGTSVNWKNLDLSVQLAFQIGGLYLSKDIADNMYGNMHSLGSIISKEVYNNTWTPENPNAKFPMQIAGLDAFWSGASVASWTQTDLGIFDASYLSVKNITLGYTLPNKITDRWGIGSIRAYGSVDNMWLMSAKKGLDPRMDGEGGMNVGIYSYPQIRTMSLGVNINF